MPYIKGNCKQLLNDYVSCINDTMKGKATTNPFKDIMGYTIRDSKRVHSFTGQPLGKVNN